MPVKITLYI